MFPASFLRDTKQYHHLSYISLCNYTLLPSTVKVLETFLKAILWKPFQLFCHILNDVSSITKVLSHQCWFQSREQVKISSSQVRRVWQMLQCCHIVLDYEILDQKPTNMPEHCHEGETNCWLSISHGISFWLYLYGDKGCQCQLMRQKVPSSSNSHTLYQQIPVNYTGGFQEPFKVNIC